MCSDTSDRISQGPPNSPLRRKKAIQFMLVVTSNQHIYLFLCFMVELVGKSCEIVANILKKEILQVCFDDGWKNLTHGDPNLLALARTKDWSGDGYEEASRVKTF